MQQEDFYPFGLTFNSYTRENTVPQNYLYNGKEQVNDLNLDWADYGARMYMPEIGRWGVVDSKTDKYAAFSPYNYVLNSPLVFKDPDGKEIYFVTPSGAVLAATQENLKNTQLASAYKGVMSTESGRQTWNTYAKNDQKDVYITVSENAENSSTINGLSIYDLDKNKDGVADKNVSDGYEGFVGVNFSKSKNKQIALISLKKSDFENDPDAIDEKDKVGQSETLFHEMKAHVETDDKGKQGHDAEKNHNSYGSKISVMNMGSGTISSSSSAGKFL